jgi:hypothetical protein
MNRKSRSSFLEEEIRLLVQFFGIEKVRLAVTKVSNGMAGRPERLSHVQAGEAERKANPSIAVALDQLKQVNEESYRILADFYNRAKDKKVLSESQDIRQFAHLIGLKEIGGKSRKDMIPRLMRFLMEQPHEQLLNDINLAASISEHQREQGFSVLTDNLLGNKGDKHGSS